ncbi:MAG: murein biosynthesis integral membrane protein MurJ [Syntrophobacteraceae bacterium]
MRDMEPVQATRATYSQISRATAIIVGLTLVDKVLAVGKEMLMAQRFGVSEELDAFNIALAFPGVVTLFLSGAIVSALVPLYLEWTTSHSPEEASTRAVRLFYALTLFFSIAALAACVASPALIGIMGYGFDPEVRSLAVSLQRLLTLLIVLDGAGTILRGLLQAQKSFFGLSAAPIFVNCLIILMLVLGKELGIGALVWGTLAGTLCKTAYMLVLLVRQGVRFVPMGLPTRETLKPFLFLAIPLLGSELMSNSNLLVDQAMATQLAAGSVSTLRYAYRINDLPVQVVIIAISRSIFPFVAEQSLADDRSPLRQLFKHSVIVLAFLTFPLICFTVLFSEEIVGFLLQRGAFVREATRETAGTLACFSCGLFFYAYTFVNGTFFSAMRDTRTLFLMGCLSVLLNVALNLLFIRWIGVKGIALSTTVTLGILSVLFVTLLTHRLQFTDHGDLCRSLLRLALASTTIVVVGVALKQVSLRFDVPLLLSLPASVVILAVTYLATVRAASSPDIASSLSLLISPDRIPESLSFLWAGKTRR